MAKLLVVEDDDMIRDMISRRLSWEGHTVVTAVNGIEALSAAQAEQPDLILMDMGLPLLNGWQVTQRIRQDEVLRATPIIALTAFAMTEDRDRSLEAGCNDYETKPVAFSRLLTKINGLLADATSRSVPEEP